METKQLFKERRSVNFFQKNQKINKDTLKDIIEMAVTAPSAFNLQPWRIIAVESTEAKQKLMTLSNNQPKVAEASVNLILIGNKKGWNNENPVWEEMLQSVGGNEKIVEGAKKAAAYLYGSSDERSLKFAESNTGLLAMSIMLSAKEHGVDSHPMSGIDFEGIHKEFGLNEGEVVVMTLCLGYYDKSQNLYPQRLRLGYDKIVTLI